jgi:hypothetical protein
MRGRPARCFEDAGRFLVGGKGLEANPTFFNDKAGNLAGLGEYSLHGTQ